jgi:hypothetical protein
MQSERRLDGVLSVLRLDMPCVSRAFHRAMCLSADIQGAVAPGGLGAICSQFSPPPWCPIRNGHVRGGRTGLAGDSTLSCAEVLGANVFQPQGIS